MLYFSINLLDTDMVHAGPRDSSVPTFFTVPSAGYLPLRTAVSLKNGWSRLLNNQSHRQLKGIYMTFPGAVIEHSSKATVPGYSCCNRMSQWQEPKGPGHTVSTLRSHCVHTESDECTSDHFLSRALCFFFFLRFYFYFFLNMCGCSVVCMSANHICIYGPQRLQEEVRSY